MDDLISRATLLKDLSYCAPELWQDEEYIKAKIMKQPIIDACPVEWLDDKFMDIQNKDKALSRAAWLVLHAWQKEQEAHGT